MTNNVLEGLVNRMAITLETKAMSTEAESEIAILEKSMKRALVQQRGIEGLGPFRGRRS